MKICKMIQQIIGALCIAFMNVIVKDVNGNTINSENYTVKKDVLFKNPYIQNS